MPTARRTSPRASAAARGYDWAHQQERVRLAPAVATGAVTCARAAIGQCLEARDGRSPLIRPGQPWDLGHNAARTTWTGPEHRRCNRADGARRGNRARARRARTAQLPTW